MDDALRERDLDAFPGEHVEDDEIDVGLDVAGPFSGSRIQKLIARSMPSAENVASCTDGAGSAMTRATVATAASSFGCNARTSVPYATCTAVCTSTRGSASEAFSTRVVIRDLVRHDRLAPVERADHRVAGADVGDPASKVSTLTMSPMRRLRSARITKPLM